MSVKHPIIAVTGSSGAGTSTVMQSFKNIFRRENLNAQVIEGDAFHRAQHLPAAVLDGVDGVAGLIDQLRRDRHRQFAQIPP